MRLLCSMGQRDSTITYTIVSNKNYTHWYRIDLIRLTRVPTIGGRFQLLVWAFRTAATIIHYLCQPPALSSVNTVLRFV